MHRALCAWTLAGLAGAVAAQTDPHAHHAHASAPPPPAAATGSNAYAALRQQEIKALSPQQIDDLRRGRGMGLSLPAELNGVPGPLHVLQLRERLQLTPQQETAARTISAAMQRDAVALGEEVIGAERELEALFREGRASGAEVDRLTARIGALQGRLRAVHLKAHLAMKELLQPQQLAAYDAARGYAADPAPAHRP